ncbi:MAG TPA: nucleotidyltransferase family protein [Novosphingobium sp.]|nr:nucleotidyltransferase family protein [Novosphingobium sp.]
MRETTAPPMIARDGYPALFELLWPRGAAAISQIDWPALDRMAGQHRLRPLLAKRMQAIPEPFASEWTEASQRSALRALGQRAELVRIDRLFAAEGIPTVALKGSAIVWRGWIEPELRPMRDLDLLVPAEQALAAHALLRAKGFTGRAATELNADKHLPGLTSPDNVHVEVHTHLVDPINAEWTERDEAWRARALTRLDRSAGFATLCSADTLLHVVVHAVLDHQFNNGPLLLLDIELLVRHGAIDWDWFWQQADGIAAVPACQIALRLAEDRIPGVVVDWRGHAPTDLAPEVLRDAAAMMLVDMARLSELGAAGRVARLPGGDRLQSLRRMIARAANRPAPGLDAPPRLARLASLIGRYLSVALRGSERRHVQRSLAVAKWLREADKSRR